MHAERNARVLPQGQRHSEVIKKFHCSLSSMLVHWHLSLCKRICIKLYHLCGTIGEDATRVISRVEYDSQTDRCVGFVLPLSENGLPLIDSFLAVSFDVIKNMFAKHATAKYAYVFMAQPLAQNTPAFCLACFGTDNKFQLYTCS